METTYTVRADRLAALREHIRQTHPEPREGVVEAALHEQIDAMLDRLRDQYRTDWIDAVEFMRRLSDIGKLHIVMGAATQSPDLSAYLDKMQRIGGVWAGSPETAQGIGMLVAGGLLTQGEADALLAYPSPELPA